MNPISVRTLLLLLFFISLVAAANFTQCLEDFKANPNATGGVDSHGHAVSAADAVGLTYRTCTERCGKASKSFSWRQFAQLFASWLLPWLALISQLPFGSGDYVDDFLSLTISVGSPALAAYSLMITAFNARRIRRKAKQITHENSRGVKDVARVLIAIQQKPLELTKDERLLRSIPTDNKWIEEILERLDRENAWTLATGSSVAWVVIAFLFTLIDSFISLNDSLVSLDDPGSGGYEGLAIGTLWLWLLCLVIGWLWVPIFSSSQIDGAIGHANSKAAETVKGMDEKEKEKEKQESIREGGTQVTEVTELGFNPDSSKSASSLQVPAESQQDHDRYSAGRTQTVQQSVTSVVRSAESQSPDSDGDKLLIPLLEIGSLHRDEFRHSATFNYARIMRYLALVDDVFRALGRVDKRGPAFQDTTTRTTYPPGALETMFNAATFALILQCGVTGAAAIIIIFTPTVGLGCRSLGYIIYGGLAIIIMFLTMISTILARISETRGDRSPFVKGLAAFFAISIRRICYLLAFFNSVGLVALSCFQFSYLLANCYCNSSVIGRGTNSYIVIFLQDWIPTMRQFRVIGMIIAASCISIFMVFLRLLSSLK